MYENTSVVTPPEISKTLSAPLIFERGNEGREVTKKCRLGGISKARERPRGTKTPFKKIEGEEVEWIHGVFKIQI